MLTKNSSILTVVLLSFVVPAFAQDSAKSLSGPADPEKGVDKTEIKLDRRTENEYGKSAYSFRYRTQAKSKHKNYVDVVYSANGNLRVSNHGGMESGVIDLGEKVGEGFDIGNIKLDQWQKREIKPVTGHYYVYHVMANPNRMTVVFRVDQLSEDQVGITAWYEKGKDKWPVSLERRGAAGTSGMNLARSSAR